MNGLTTVGDETIERKGVEMARIGEEKVVRTVCGIVDGIHCGILAHVRDGVLVKVEPADFPDTRFRHICARAL